MFKRLKNDAEAAEDLLEFIETAGFYLTIMDDPVCSIRFFSGMEASIEEVRKKYPHTLELTIPFIETMDDGFPSQTETARINQIEDSFITGSYDIRQIGVITGDGCVRYIFCFAGSKNDLKKIVKVLMRKHKRVEFSTIVGWNDQLWYYEHILKPNIYERNWMINNSQCSQLKNDGEAFQTIREIDFCCIFSSSKHMQAMTEQLREQGFHEIRNEEIETSKHMLQFVLNEIPSFEKINEITNEIIYLLEGTEGYFDGWGCPVYKE